MLQVVKFPCPKCKHLTKGTLIVKSMIGTTKGEDYFLVRFIADCCKTEFVRLFNIIDLHHYLKEIK